MLIVILVDLFWVQTEANAAHEPFSKVGIAAMSDHVRLLKAVEMYEEAASRGRRAEKVMFAFSVVTGFESFVSNCFQNRNLRINISYL